MDFASWKDREILAGALKAIYRAKEAVAGQAALDFGVSWTIRARPSNPLRMSVWRVASHARTPLGIGTIAATAPR